MAETEPQAGDGKGGTKTLPVPSYASFKEDYEMTLPEGRIVWDTQTKDEWLAWAGYVARMRPEVQHLPPEEQLGAALDTIHGKGKWSIDEIPPQLHGPRDDKSLPLYFVIAPQKTISKPGEEESAKLDQAA